MIIDYIDTIEKISIKDLLFDQWDNLIKEYIVGRDTLFVSKNLRYECCLKCHLIKQNFYSGWFGVYSYRNCIKNFKKDLFNILNEKQNKVILDILETNLIDDLKDDYRGIFRTDDLPYCFSEEDLIFDDICEIVDDRKSSKINRINKLRKRVGYIREEILSYPKHFKKFKGEKITTE